MAESPRFETPEDSTVLSQLSTDELRLIIEQSHWEMDDPRVAEAYMAELVRRTNQ